MDLKDGLEFERFCFFWFIEVFVMFEYMGEERGDYLVLGIYYVLFVRW